MKEQKVYKRGQSRATLYQERFCEAGVMDRILFFEKDISDGGGSVMLTVPRESHGHHLHRGHHIGGHRDPGNQLEQQYEKNLSTQQASDQ